MDGFQDGSRVSGIHLSTVSTFSFKSLLTLADVCLLLTAWPEAGRSICGTPSQKGLQGLHMQGLEDPPLSFSHLPKPSVRSCEVWNTNPGDPRHTSDPALTVLHKSQLLVW